MARSRTASPERPARKTITLPASVGVNVPRKDGRDKVTGAALYLDDLRVPGVLHGRTEIGRAHV